MIHIFFKLSNQISRLVFITAFSLSCSASLYSTRISYIFVYTHEPSTLSERKICIKNELLQKVKYNFQWLLVIFSMKLIISLRTISRSLQKKTYVHKGDRKVWCGGFGTIFYHPMSLNWTLHILYVSHIYITNISKKSTLPSAGKRQNRTIMYNGKESKKQFLTKKRHKGDPYE